MDSDIFLSVATCEPTTTFAGFESLIRLLRKPLKVEYHGFISLDREYQRETEIRSSILEHGYGSGKDCEQSLHIELNFNLQRPTTREDIRISVLSLVMETSSMEGRYGAYITIIYPKAHENNVVQAKQRIHLRTLRCNVADGREVLQPHNRLTQTVYAPRSR